MLKFISLLPAVVFIAITGYADTITPPYNTGVTATGQVSIGGSIDQHFSSGGSTVYVLQNPAYWAWIGPDLASAWIGPDADSGETFSGGFYTLDYSITFNLSGYNPESVVIIGLIAVDNTLNDIRVNGVSNATPNPGFFAWTPFTLSQGFISGMNTIDFDFTNDGGPGGLRIEFTSATGTASSSTPEPVPMVLVGLTIACVGLYRRRSKH